MKNTKQRRFATRLATLALSGSLLFPSTLAFANETSKKADTVQTSSSVTVDLEQAKKLALETVGSGKLIGFEQDLEGKAPHYELSILVGNLEKEVKIDAKTGKVMKQKQKYLSKRKKDKLLVTSEPKLSLEAAGKAIKEKYPKADLLELKLDSEAGKLVYEASLLDQNQERELELDATTGQMTELDEEQD